MTATRDFTDADDLTSDVAAVRRLTTRGFDDAIARVAAWDLPPYPERFCQ